MSRQQLDEIEYTQFAGVDIRVGEIVEATEFPEARKPAYKVKVDFGGDIGVRQSSAQITKAYSTEELIGKRVLGCVNLGTKRIAGFKSEFLLLGINNADGDVILATVDKEAPIGNFLH